jgi:hypothetical protein
LPRSLDVANTCMMLPETESPDQSRRIPTFA